MALYDKRVLKRANNLRLPDDTPSLSEGWHIIAPRKGDAYYKVGIVDPDGMTHAEIAYSL